MGLVPGARRAPFVALLDLDGKAGLVVGGGAVAARSAEALLRSGVHVTVVAPELCPQLAGLVLAGAMRHEARRFVPGDLAEVAIAFAATDDAAVNEAVSAEARALRVPVNVAGDVGLSTFAMPSLFGKPSMPAEASVRAHAPSAGFVSLVGAGPGDPELLTLRALRVMQGADVVLYDHLVAPALVELARCEAERIYVGKEQDNHALDQREINALMVRLARQGRHVVRLKGGDPFVFGRGGEEIEALASQGIDFEVVPGVTAAVGAAAYAGIPLTHRDYAQSCVFVTGHLKQGALDLDWRAIARPRQTVVVYMGVGALKSICDGLVAHGLPPGLPAAIVERATLPAQRVIEGTLASLPAKAIEGSVRPPALLIAGEVVLLRERLAWFDRAAVASEAS
ncbi:MAG: uroporphyrinogen-III C-methyltransferase [Burkholderiales bacterium]